jgi:hypothetical protein
MVAADVDVCLNNYTLGGCIYTGQASCQIRVESAGARSICTNWAANISQRTWKRQGRIRGRKIRAARLAGKLAPSRWRMRASVCRSGRHIQAGFSFPELLSGTGFIRRRRRGVSAKAELKGARPSRGCRLSTLLARGRGSVTMRFVTIRFC